MAQSQATALQIDHRRRIQNVLLHIEKYLHRGITIDELARIACFSPFHFQRIFFSYTGESVGRHLQRKRMERAIHLLSKNSLTILEIALEVGYETPAALTKLFIRWTGEPPSSYRRKIKPSHLQSFDPLPLPTLSGKHNPNAVCKTLPDLLFVFIEVHGMTDGNFIDSTQEAFKDILHWVESHQLHKKVVNFMGMVLHKPLSYQDQLTPFWFGCTMAERLNITIPFKTLEFQPGKVATFMHQGPYEYLTQTWNHAYRGWLPGSGHELSDRPPFELYLNNPKTTPPEKLLTEVCIPIIIP